MDLGPHAGFIIISYAICLAVVFGLIAWVILDRRRQEADLAELAKQGINRASAAKNGKASEAADA